MQTVRQKAIAFAAKVILRSTDHQEVETALADHDEFGPWLDGDLDVCQSIVRAAERRLGDRLPTKYS